MTFKEAAQFVTDWQKAQIKLWVIETRWLCLLSGVVGYFIGVVT